MRQIRLVASINGFLRTLLPDGPPWAWAWWQIALLPTSIFLLMAWSVVASVLSPFYFGITLIDNISALSRRRAEAKSERDELAQHLEKIRSAGRIMPWEQLQPKLHAGALTLIIEDWIRPALGGGYTRFWWTAEDVRAMSPVPIPNVAELDLFGLSRPHAFVIWCSNRYLHPDHGMALLTEPTGGLKNWITTGGTSRFMQNEFPGLQIVQTTLYRQVCRHCGYDMRATPDRCPECGRPAE